MNDYEKLVQITSEKLHFSKSFLKITKDIQNLINKQEIDDIYIELDKRDDIIEKINSLDQNFLSLYQNLKKDKGFENNIKFYPKLKEYIQEIEHNFIKSDEIDNNIRPIMLSQLNNIKEEMKKIKTNQNNKIISNKYSKETFRTLTESNFGIFIDEKK